MREFKEEAKRNIRQLKQETAKNLKPKIEKLEARGRQNASPKAARCAQKAASAERGPNSSESNKVRELRHQVQELTRKLNQVSKD